MSVSAQNLGVNPDNGMYQVKVKASNYVKTGDYKIREFDDKYEARKFVYNVNHGKISGQPAHDCFNCSAQSGFAPEQKPLPDYQPKPINLLPKWLKVGCDMPEDGGISGNMNKPQPKPPYAFW